MRTKYKSTTTRYRARMRKHHEVQKSIIKSSYELNESELAELKNQFKDLEKFPIETVIDPALLAGVVLLIGTNRIDLSLSRGLHSLKQYLYEHS